MKYGWQRVARRKDIPPVAGCYALYERGALVYIGSSINLKARLGTHLRQPRQFHGCDGWVQGVNPITFAKIKVTRRCGDWIMWEWRLITRLQPRDNRAGVSKKA